MYGASTEQTVDQERGTTETAGPGDPGGSSRGLTGRDRLRGSLRGLDLATQEARLAPAGSPPVQLKEAEGGARGPEAGVEDDDAPWYGGVGVGMGLGQQGTVKGGIGKDGDSVSAGADVGLSTLAKRWPAAKRKIDAVMKKLSFSKNFMLWTIPCYFKVGPSLVVGGAAALGNKSSGKLAVTVAGTATLGVGACGEDFEVGAYGALSLSASASIEVSYDIDKDELSVAPLQIDVKGSGKVGVKAQFDKWGPDISKTLAEWDLAHVRWGGYVNGVAQPATATAGKDLLRLIAWFEAQGAWLKDSWNGVKGAATDAYDYVTTGETETDRLQRENDAFDARDEEAMAADRAAKDAQEQTDRIWKSSAAHHEAKAFSEAEQRKQEVAAAMARWTPQVNAARTAASSASWPWNKAAKEGRALTAAQQRAYDPGNAAYHAAHDKYRIFNEAARYANDEAGVARCANAAIAAYDEAAALWKSKHGLLSG